MSKDVYELMEPLIGDLPNEEFWVVSINQAGRIIKKVRISVGGIDQTSADIRLIMRVLIDTGRCSSQRCTTIRVATADRAMRTRG